MPALMRSLFGQVMVALVLGIVAGVLWPDFAAAMKPLGVATVVLAAWEGDIDRARAHAVLNGEGADPSETALFEPEPERA